MQQNSNNLTLAQQERIDAFARELARILRRIKKSQSQPQTQKGKVQK